MQHSLGLLKNPVSGVLRPLLCAYTLSAQTENGKARRRDGV